MAENIKSQTNQNTNQEVQPQKQKRGLSWWLSALTGKTKKSSTTVSPSTPASQEISRVQKKMGSTQGKTQKPNQINPTQGQTKQGQKQQSTATEDSVKQDIAKFKNFMGKISGKVSQKVGPAVEKGRTDVKQKSTETVNKMINTGAMKKILMLFFVIVLVMVVSFIGLNFFKRSPEEEAQGGQTASEPTPTSPPFVPYRPSVYAEDLEIIKLDEEISTLEREFASADIRETPLNIPDLDFDVSF